uniref:Putative secreted peptide n=1 Tax=Anopheles braziliensis TaxID=58242 RepID=A0A2M3ZW02_9DIPT
MYVAPPQLLIWLSLLPAWLFWASGLVMDSRRRREYNYNCKKKTRINSPIVHSRVLLSHYMSTNSDHRSPRSFQLS